jgi:hypothetical protein
LLIASFFSTTKKEYFYVIPFMVLICFSKYAALVPTGVFIGIIALLFALKKEYKLLISLALAFPFVYLTYKYFNGSDAFFAKIELEKKGAWIDWLLPIAEKYHINGSTAKKVTIAGTISIFLWIGYKAALLLLLKFSKDIVQKRYLNFIFIALAITLIVSFIPGFILNINYYDSFGKKIWDIKSDLMQFVRGGILFFTIFSIIACLVLVFYNSSKKVATIFYCCTLMWCALHLTYFVKATLKKPDLFDTVWYNQVKEEFEITKPKLMVVKGTEFYSGTCLSSYGIGPWYCTGTTNSIEGYNMSLESYTRSIQFQQIFDTSFAKTADILESIKKQGVDYVAFTPLDSIAKNKLLEKQFIAKVFSNRWIYKLK